MSTIRSKSDLSGGLPPSDNPFYYGYRYVARMVKGRRQWVQKPLTRDDVLHPREGDKVTQNDDHDRDCIYLAYVVRNQLRHEQETLVAHDFLIKWDVPGMKGHGPDLTVIRGVPPPHPRDSFDVAAAGVRPELIIEVTSPSTRNIDLNDKRRHYWQARVPVYVIVDEQFRRGQRHLRILPYRPGPRAYRRQRLDARGWFWLEAVQLWLGQENGRVALYNAQGNRIPSYDEETELRRQAEERAIQAKERATQAEERATQAEERATQAEERATQEKERATQAKERAARLAELARKARQGVASPEELRELERLEEQLLPP